MADMACEQMLTGLIARLESTTESTTRSIVETDSLDKENRRSAATILCDDDTKEPQSLPQLPNTNNESTTDEIEIAEYDDAQNAETAASFTLTETDNHAESDGINQNVSGDGNGQMEVRQRYDEWNVDVIPRNGLLNSASREGGAVERENDDLSSVSTHSSMPSLLTDNESEDMTDDFGSSSEETHVQDEDDCKVDAGIMEHDAVEEEQEIEHIQYEIEQQHDTDTDSIGSTVSD